MYSNLSATMSFHNGLWNSKERKGFSNSVRMGLHHKDVISKFMCLYEISIGFEMWKEPQEDIIWHKL